jgi:hypothetical protein
VSADQIIASVLLVASLGWIVADHFGWVKR